MAMAPFYTNERGSDKCRDLLVIGCGEDETANIMRYSWAFHVVALVNGMGDRK